MDKTNFAESILAQYRNGQRYFSDLDLERENFDAQFARSKVGGVYFDNNWIYGQKITQAAFDRWIKDLEE